MILSSLASMSSPALDICLSKRPSIEFSSKADSFVSTLLSSEERSAIYSLNDLICISGALTLTGGPPDDGLGALIGALPLPLPAGGAGGALLVF